jgi:hypothetical protein
MQAHLRDTCPGLQAGLFQRLNDRSDVVTLMETYKRQDADVDPTLQAQIEKASAVLAPWCAAGRHVEVFDQLG